MRHKFATRRNHDSSRHSPSRDLSSQVGFCLENQSLTWHWCDQKAILYLYVVVEQPIYLTIKCGDQIGSFVDFYNHAGYITYMIWMFPKIGGKPPKWMVYFMENPIYEQMDDLGGFPTIFGSTPISLSHPDFLWTRFPYREAFKPCVSTTKNTSAILKMKARHLGKIWCPRLWTRQN